MVTGLSATGIDTRLVQAAKRQDRAAVRALLKAGVNVNASEPDGATALLWAAQWDDAETAELLIHAGARVMASNDYGVTPLTMAATNGSVAMIKRLLKSGASPNTALPSGETALMSAALTGRVEAVAALADGGADLNSKEGTKGQTALMWAIAEEHRDVVRFLVERGADVRIRATSGFTALLLAARYNDIETIKLLLGHGASVAETANDGTTALHVAALRGHVELVKFLLDQGADPNADKAGYTALHWAAGNWDNATSISFGRDGGELQLMGGIPQARKMELLRALIDHGADINTKMVKAPPLGRLGPTGTAGTIIGGGPLTGATPFFLAALASDVETMCFLVATGADPLVSTKDGTTPLMAAAGVTGFYDLESNIPESAHLKAVDFALRLGGDVKAINDLGNTALHIATHGGFDSVVKFLVQQGSLVNAKNKAGETPLRIADGVIVIMMLYTHPSTAVLLRGFGGTY
jgi:ankyrin repeat protein